MSLACQGWAPAVLSEAGPVAVNLAVPLYLLRVAGSRRLGVSSLSVQSQAGEPGQS